MTEGPRSDSTGVHWGEGVGERVTEIEFWSIGVLEGIVL